MDCQCCNCLSFQKHYDIIWNVVNTLNVLSAQRCDVIHTWYHLCLQQLRRQRPAPWFQLRCQWWFGVLQGSQWGPQGRCCWSETTLYAHLWARLVRDLKKKNMLDLSLRRELIDYLITINWNGKMVGKEVLEVSHFVFCIWSGRRIHFSVQTGCTAELFSFS